MNIDELKAKALGLVDELKSKFSRGKKSDEEEYDDAEYEEITGEFNEGEFGDLDIGTEFDVGADEATSEIDMEDEYEDEEDDEETEIEVDEDEAAAKKQKIVRTAIIVLAIVYIGWELISPDQTPSKKPPTQSQKKKEKKPSRKKEKPKEKVAKKKESKLEKKKEETPAPKPIVEQPEKTVDPMTEQVKDMTKDMNSNPMNDLVDDPNANMKNFDGVDDGSTSPEGSIIPNNASDKIKDLNISNDMSKILRETEKQVKKTIDYTAPPDYTKFGRGLVFNCKAKHWACVDRKRWFECKDNLKFTEFYGKDRECHPVNVYSTMRDCRTMQLYNINTNVDTGFCE